MLKLLESIKVIAQSTIMIINVVLEISGMFNNYKTRFNF